MTRRERLALARLHDAAVSQIWGGLAELDRRGLGGSKAGRALRDAVELLAAARPLLALPGRVSGGSGGD